MEDLILSFVKNKEYLSKNTLNQYRYKISIWKSLLRVILIVMLVQYLIFSSKITTNNERYLDAIKVYFPV